MIVVSGHLCLDLFPDLSAVAPEALGAGGRLVESGPLAISAGGVVSNTGLALHRLGVEVGLMATVGDDLLGKTISEFLSARDPRLAEMLRVQPGAASSYSVVLAPGTRDRTFLHCPGTNATFGPEHVSYDAVTRAKIFHLGYPPLLPRLIAHDGAALRELFARVKAAGVVTSMDMCVPDANGPSGRVNWGVVLRSVLPHVDVFLPSIDEALFMLRRADHDRWRGDTLSHVTKSYLRELADELLSFGAVVAGFKLGEKGFYVRTASNVDRIASIVDKRDWESREHWQPAYLVEVAGTTGAGDSAYAGFLAAMLRGMPPHAAIQLATAVGACNIEKIDATSGVRTWEETLARVESGWKTRAEVLNG